MDKWIPTGDSIDGERLYEQDGELAVEKDASHLVEFRVDSQARAEWLLRKLGNIDAERARIENQAAAMLAALDVQERKLKRRHWADLEVWATAQMEQNGTRTLRTLQGTMALRRVSPRISVQDPAAALEHASRHLPEAVVVEAALDTKVYIAEVKRAGKVLPGVFIVPARDSFSVKFPSDLSEGGREEEE